MKAPKCRVCGAEHWGPDHVFKGDAAKVSELLTQVVHAPKVVHTVVHTEAKGSSRHGKYADAEARKEYRREWMKKKRAK